MIIKLDYCRVSFLCILGYFLTAKVRNGNIFRGFRGKWEMLGQSILSKENGEHITPPPPHSPGSTCNSSSDR